MIETNFLFHLFLVPTKAYQIIIQFMTLHQKKIYISSPNILASNDTLVWPSSNFKISKIKIDDGKSKILGYDTKQILIKIIYDEDLIKSNIEWDNILSKKYNYKILENGKLLSIPISYSDNGKIIELSDLYLSTPSNFDDILSTSKIKILFSFDDGRNFYEEREVINIWRIKDLSFYSDCLHDIDTKEILPTLILKEDNDNTTIDEGQS